MRRSRQRDYAALIRSLEQAPPLTIVAPASTAPASVLVDVPVPELARAEELERLYVSERAAEQMAALIGEHNEGSAGHWREAGGELWGVAHLPATVLAATLNVLESTYRSMRFGPIERIPDMGPGVPRLVGDWHLHPAGDREPSRADLNLWAGMLDPAGGQAWVGVIAAPGEAGFGLSLSAWSITRAGAHEIPITYT